MRLRLCGLILVLLSTGSFADYGPQRQAFVEAEQALRRGELSTFERLKAGLGDYPLLPYLEYQQLTRRGIGMPSSAVQGFLERHADTPLAPRMRAKWLKTMANRQRWQEFLVGYDGSGGVELRCHYLQALLATRAREKAFILTEDIWLHGRSRPDACDPVFDAWRRAGRQSAELTWQRIALAMREGEHGLATYLKRFLPESERRWVANWVQLHHQPRHAQRRAAFKTAHPYRTTMLAHAVKRMARRDRLGALAMWRDLERSYEFEPAIRSALERDLAITLSRESHPDAARFVDQVQPGSHDERLLEAQLRSALARGDWQGLLDRHAQLPPDLADDERWRYWQARALAKTGQRQPAQKIYRELATERSFYGFLAADRIGADYKLTHQTTPVDASRLAALAAHPAALRARELRQLSRFTDARREWRHLTRGLDAIDLKAAAKLAEQWRWHDQAIFTLARTGYWDDLELRFPLRHSPAVADNATVHGLEKAWIFAVIRQESAFMENARSSAGARGLMQLMPGTARLVARKQLNRPAPKRHELFRPELNIALGTAYLRRVLDRLGQHQVLALAAYNAGPHRVEKWLPNIEQDADIWIELVPFRETRGYLRRVLAYTAIYEQRLGKTPTRLSKRMRPIMSLEELAADDRSDGNTQG